MQSRRWRIALAVPMIMLLASGCAASPRARLRELAIEEARLQGMAHATEQAVDGASAYAEELEAGRLAPSLLMSAATLDQVTAQSVPLELPAKEFHSQLAGKIRVERVSGFRLLSRNRLRCQLHLRGSGIRFTGSIPSMFKKEVSDFIKAFENGGADIELELLLSVQNGKLYAKGQALSAKLPTARNANAAGLLRDEMNDRALSRPLVIGAAAPSGSALRRVLVTPHHVVLTYAGP